MNRIINPLISRLTQRSSIRISHSVHQTRNTPVQTSVRSFVQLSTANVIQSVAKSNRIDVLTTKSGALQLSNRFLAWARGRPEASMLRVLRQGNFRTDPVMIRMIERFGDKFGLENAASTEDLTLERYEYDPRLPRDLVENELNETGTFDRDAVMLRLAKSDRFKSAEELSEVYELLSSVQRVPYELSA